MQTKRKLENEVNGNVAYANKRPHALVEKDSKDRTESLRNDEETDYDDEVFPEDDDLQGKSEETVIIMDSGSISKTGTDTAFEIEKDMRAAFKFTKGKISVQEYVESLAARYPLLGIAVLDENSREAVETIAQKAIKLSLNQTKVLDWAYLSVFLTTIQHAKNWDRASSSGFWPYICEQFGYKYSQPMYDFLTNAVKTACRKYNRFFVVVQKGDNSYYSTVLAHALSPSKSFNALCEFLFKFYRNNLDCSVYEDDPAIGRMVSILRDRCRGATIEHDEDIRGNVIGIQVGLRALLTTRPGYMRHFLTKVLQKIGVLLGGGELAGKDYIDILLTQWYVSKLTEPMVKKAAPTHKRTTEIAFSYGRIRVEYILADDGEPAIRVPSIRLASRENPVVIIRSNTELVYQHTIGIYGNDYAATSEEVVIPLSDICDADFTGITAEITIDGKQIYQSGDGLGVRAIIFKDKKHQTGKTIDEGNYVLFAPRSVNIDFQGFVERQRRAYFEQLFDVYIQGEVSIFADELLLCCSRPPEGSVRFRLPQTQMEYVFLGKMYPIYARDEFSVNAIGTLDGGSVAVKLQTGEYLNSRKIDENSWQIDLPDKNGGYNLVLSDTETGRIYDEAHFYIVDSYSINFDSHYYLETTEDGNVTIVIDGERFDLSLTGAGAKVKIPFGSGEIHVQIPKIRMLLDGNPLPMDAIWKGDISPSSLLKVLCPDSLSVSIIFGEIPMQRRTNLGGYDYAIGNIVQAHDSAEDKKSVILVIAGNRIPLFDVVFKMSLTEPPAFNLTDTTLLWLNSHSFMGDKNTELKFVFSPKNGRPLIFLKNPNDRLLCNGFPSKSEQYRYEVYARNNTAFGIAEVQLAEGDMIFGDRAAVIYRGEVLRITRILMDGDYTDIKPVYADNINYIGVENLGYTDLSGDYAHYTAKLYFMTRNGKRFFTNLNPVDIYLVNEKVGRLHITFDGGEGLFIDKSGDYGVELYKHTDPPPKLARYFFIPDFFEYQFSKERH